MVLMQQEIVALAQIVRDGMAVERVVANDQTVIGDVPGGDMRRHRGRELLTNEIDACDLVKTREDRGEHLALLGSQFLAPAHRGDAGHQPARVLLEGQPHRCARIIAVSQLDADAIARKYDLSNVDRRIGPALALP